MKQLLTLTLLSLSTLTLASTDCSMTIVGSNANMNLKGIREIVSSRGYTLAKGNQISRFALNLTLLDCAFAKPLQEGERYNTGKKICREAEYDQGIRVSLGNPMGDSEHRSKILAEVYDGDKKVFEAETAPYIRPIKAMKEIKTLIETIEVCE
jgi:hypothetical protein